MSFKKTIYVLGTCLGNSVLKVLVNYKLTFLFSFVFFVLDSSINRSFSASVIIITILLLFSVSGFHFCFKVHMKSINGISKGVVAP